MGAGDMTLAIEANLLHSSWHVPEVCSGERCKTSQRTAAMEARNKESVAKKRQENETTLSFPRQKKSPGPLDCLLESLAQLRIRLGMIQNFLFKPF